MALISLLAIMNDGSKNERLFSYNKCDTDTIRGKQKYS